MSVLRFKKQLRARLLSDAKPLLVSIDSAGRVQNILGDAAHYGYQALRLGDDVMKFFDFMVGIKAPEKIEFPFLETPNHRCARIEIDLSLERGAITFFESSNEREILQGVLKSSNENAIARYRTEETIRRYHDLQIRHGRTEQALRWSDRFKSDVIDLLKHQVHPTLSALDAAIGELGSAANVGDQSSHSAALAALTSDLRRSVAKLLGEPVVNQAPSESSQLLRRTSDRASAASAPQSLPAIAGHHVDAMIVGGEHRHTEKLIAELATRGFLVQTSQATPEGMQEGRALFLLKSAGLSNQPSHLIILSAFVPASITSRLLLSFPKAMILKPVN
jgi:hypothetical protein